MEAPPCIHRNQMKDPITATPAPNAFSARISRIRADQRSIAVDDQRITVAVRDDDAERVAFAIVAGTVIPALRASAPP